MAENRFEEINHCNTHTWGLDMGGSLVILTHSFLLVYFHKTTCRPKASWKHWLDRTGRKKGDLVQIKKKECIQTRITADYHYVTLGNWNASLHLFFCHFTHWRTYPFVLALAEVELGNPKRQRGVNFMGLSPTVTYFPPPRHVNIYLGGHLIIDWVQSHCDNRSR